MRKILIGMLLAATAAAPALADKSGKHGGPKAERHHDRGGKHAGRGGGRAFQAEARHFDRGPDRRGGHERRERFVRHDDKQARKYWKQEAKYDRKERRAFARDDRGPRVERWAPAPIRYVQRPVYRDVRYAAPAYYAEAPVRRWTGYETSNWPTSYDRYESGYANSGSGLFGSGGGGLLGALLPVVLQSVVGGDLGNAGLGGLSGLGSVGGLGNVGGLGSLGGYGDVSVLPLQQASYADPYANGTGGLGALLPSLLGGGGLF